MTGLDQLQSAQIIVQVGGHDPLVLRTVVVDRAGCGGDQLADALIALGRDLRARPCGCAGAES